MDKKTFAAEIKKTLKGFANVIAPILVKSFSVFLIDLGTEISKCDQKKTIESDKE